MDRSEEAPQNFVTDRVRNRPETLQEELTTGRYATNRTPRCIVVYLEIKREEANVAIRFARICSGAWHACGADRWYSGNIGERKSDD